MSIIKHVTLQKIVAHDFRYDLRSCFPRSFRFFLSFWASPSSVSKKRLLTKWNDGVVLTKNVNATYSAVRVQRFCDYLLGNYIDADCTFPVLLWSEYTA